MDYEASKHSFQKSNPLLSCMRRKKSHPQGGSCKGLREKSKAAALTVEPSHRQKKKRVTNCSQEETWDHRWTL